MEGRTKLLPFTEGLAQPAIVLYFLILFLCLNVQNLKKKIDLQDAWLAQSVEHLILDLSIVNLSPMLGVEIN